MRILVSNDDGVAAPGLKILVQTLRDFAEVAVVAPDRDRSGASNSLTLVNPLRVRQLENGFYSVQGTPTDCVHLALTGLLPGKPDMVIAGINEGANLGDDVLYSGTVAAAMEGRLLGIPSMAFSLVRNNEGNTWYFETAARIVKQLITLYSNRPLSSAMLNINIPNLPLNRLREFEVTRLGQRHNAEPCLKSLDPRGHEIYWVGPAGPEADAGPGTDFHAIKNGNVSITPLMLDLTHYQAMQDIAGWSDGLKL